MNRSRLLRSLTILLGALAAPVSLLAQPKVEEIVLAPDATMFAPSFTNTSKSGFNCLAHVQKGSRDVFLMDGVGSPRFDRPAGQTQVLTDNDSRHAATTIVGNEAIMAIDGRDVARTPAKAAKKR